MKKAILIIVLFAAANSSFAQKASTQSIVIKTQIYCSHCLQCGSCGANINDHIKANKGIKKVLIDPKENTITVTYNGDKITPEKIRQAILDSGFDADDQKATAKTVSALDGCCKKK